MKTETIKTFDTVKFFRSIKEKLAKNYGVNNSNVEIIVVGSSKFGFSLFEKKDRYQNTLPRFREFNIDSDIDLAIVSADIFQALWNELSYYGSVQDTMPWKSGALGLYMVHGWLRPDHFPKSSMLPKCADWYKLFNEFSRNRTLGINKIRGGLYYNLNHLKIYHVRSINSAKKQWETCE